MKIAEFFAEVGFDIDSAPLGQFFGLLQGTAGRVLIFAGAVRAAAFAVEKFSQRSIDAATALRSFRIETGLSAEELQKWQTAIQLTDISATAEDVAGSVQSLQENLTAIRLGRGDVSPFLLAGVNPYQDAFSVIDDLRASLRGVDRALAATILRDTGLGVEFLHTLSMTNEELDALMNNYVLRQGQLDNLSEAGTAFTDLGLFIRHAIDDLNAFLSPAYVAGARVLKEAIRAISAPFEVLGHIIEFVVGLIDRLSSEAAQNLYDAFKYMAIGVGVLSAAFMPLTFTLTAILLLIEDIAVGMRGGNSVIFSFARAIGSIFEGIGNFINEHIIEPFNSLLDRIPDLSFLSGVAGTTGLGLLGIGDLPSQLGTGIANTFNNIFNIVTDQPEAAANAVSNGLQQQLNFAYDDTAAVAGQ